MNTFRLTRPEPSESQVLAAVLAALRRHPRVVWAERMNSGETVIGGRRVKFGFPGCPDVLGQLRGGALLAIEVKRPSGRVSEAQAAFLERARGTGAVAAVVRSVDDLAEVLA